MAGANALNDVLARIDNAQPGSLGELQQLLDLTPPVAQALLMRLNGAGISRADRPGRLARSSLNYHAVLTALSELGQQNPPGQDGAQRVRRAMTEARFDDAEAGLRQIESQWADHGSKRAYLLEAKVEALLGRIELMKPATAQQGPATPHSVVTVTVRPVAAVPRIDIAPLPAGSVRVLLGRAELMLGIGDFLAARLLYQRAAAAGDGRGAMGAGMTYDPRVLSRLDARGMQPDPDAAKAWYRVALEMGDTSATEFLDLLSRHLGGQ